jgi:hypothetical protein
MDEEPMSETPPPYAGDNFVRYWIDKFKIAEAWRNSNEGQEPDPSAETCYLELLVVFKRATDSELAELLRLNIVYSDLLERIRDEALARVLVRDSGSCATTNPCDHFIGFAVRGGAFCMFRQSDPCKTACESLFNYCPMCGEHFHIFKVNLDEIDSISREVLSGSPFSVEYQPPANSKV